MNQKYVTKMNKILNPENIYKTIYEVGFFLGVDCWQ